MSRLSMLAAVIVAGAIGWMTATRADDPPAIDAPRPEGELVKQKLDLAKRGFKMADEYYRLNPVTIAEAGVAEWSKRIAEAELVADGTKGKLEIVAAHRDRMRQLADRERQNVDNGQMAPVNAAEAEYQLLEAESWLLKAWMAEKR